MVRSASGIWDAGMVLGQGWTVRGSWDKALFVLLPAEVSQWFSSGTAMKSTGRRRGRRGVGGRVGQHGQTPVIVLAHRVTLTAPKEGVGGFHVDISMEENKPEHQPEIRMMWCRFAEKSRECGGSVGVPRE